MGNSIQNKIFKKGSTTFYTASIFFPQKVQEDVFVLYAFVRKADDYLDAVPNNTSGFYNYKKLYQKILNSETGDFKSDANQDENLHFDEDVYIVNKFVNLKKQKQIPDEWVDSFFTSLEMDITKNSYKNYEELKSYIYGSAEVVGLMMAKIMDLPQDSYIYAQKLGESMQFINMIRDIKEDGDLGRCYMPGEDLEKFGVKNLYEKSENLLSLIRFEIDRYFEIVKGARQGYKFIPYRYLVPVKTASDMYDYTAHVIYDNPDIIFEKKVKPGKSKIFSSILKNTVSPKFPRNISP